MEHEKRHRFIWKALLPLFRLWMRLKFRYHSVPTPPPGPALIVSNHCTDWDPFLLGLTIHTPVYFIASEHIFRKKLAGRLILWLQAPIVRLKGTTAGDTALATVRRIRRGCSVAVFAEGNRSYNGRTADIIESTAKLAKAAGGCLVTHRFRGGYLSSPRWAGDSCRRGRLTGEVVRVYSPEELKKMRPAEIADAIRRDIREDAFATQREWMVPYKGRRLAEHLERALCICPRCGRLGALQSRDDRFFCTACGMETRYTEYGFFEGGELPFDNVLAWDQWQAGEMLRLAENAGDEPLAADTSIRVVEVLEGHGERLHGVGELKIFRDRFDCAGLILPFAEVTGIGLSGPQGIDLSAAGRHFSLTSAQPRNLRKYVSLYRAFTDPEHILAI